MTIAPVYLLCIAMTGAKFRTRALGLFSPGNLLASP